MYNFPIALALYSLKDDMASDFEGTLKKVKAMGYDGVEFAGKLAPSAAEIKGMCNEIGLIPISAHVPFLWMLEDSDIMLKYKEIGCQNIVIPSLPIEYRPGKEKFSEAIEHIKAFGKKANELDMKLSYHNHEFEFVRLDGEYGIDILYKEVSANLLKAQFDTCWVNVGGENPADYVKKYAGRQETIHLKDFVGSKSENMYALVGVDENKKKDIVGDFKFCPIGQGVQDFSAILTAATEAGVKWVIVEQDTPSRGKTSLECAAESISYLKSIF